MDEQTFQDNLKSLLEALMDLDLDDREEVEGALGTDVFEVSAVSTFAESGVLTNNKGLVVRLGDGSKWQLTLVQDHRSW